MIVLDVKTNPQNLEKIIRLLVGLGEQTQGEGSYSIVAPGSKKRDEKGLTILPHVRLSIHFGWHFKPWFLNCEASFEALTTPAL